MVRFFRLAAFAAIGSLGAASVRAQTPPTSVGINPKPGFPKTLAAARESHGASVWADLGLNGGRKSLVFGTYGRKLYVVNHDGTVASGWPQTLPGDVASSPAVGDLDGDGIPDIVVGYGSTIETALTGSSVGGVRAYRRNGTMMWERIAGNFSGATQPPVMSTPAIGDIDGDGVAWVAWGGLDGNVYLVRGSDGSNRPGWPIFVRDTIFSSPTLFDLDGDGKLEVIIGVDTHQDPTAFPPGFPTQNGGRLHVIRANATEMAGFPKDIDEVIISSPAVGDIDGDGKPEIVVGTGLYWGNTAHRVYAWRCDGSAQPGWPVTTAGKVITSPALADLDGDGIPEVVVTDYNPSGISYVYAIKGNGSILWQTAPLTYFGAAFRFWGGDPVIADILGDGKPEVLVPLNTELCVISATGVQLTDGGGHGAGSYSIWTGPSAARPAAIDVDNGVLNIATISATPGVPNPPDTVVFAWTTSKTAAPTSLWGTFRQNAARTGFIPGTPKCSLSPPLAGPLGFYTLAPCRAVDTRDPPGPFGGPLLAAQATRPFTLAGQCGVPSDAAAISLNVTVADQTTNGSLVLFPGTGAVPGTNSISFSTGTNRANNVIMGLIGGTLSVDNDQASGTVNLILDVNGYFK